MRKVYAIVLFVALSLLIGSFAYVHQAQDLMWDEVVSLFKFSFDAFGTTATKYTEPNNHIAFNLYQNALTRITGSRDLLSVMDWIPFFRLGQFFFALWTFRYTFLLSRKVFDEQTAWIAVILLASTLPFTNFFMQLRGYNFAMLFLVGMLYHSWAYYLDGKKLHWWASVVFPFLLVYTLPSNAYLYLSVSSFWLLLCLRQYFSMTTIDRTPLALRSFHLILALALAAFLLFLAYSPILDQVLHNRYVDQVPSNRFYVLQELLPELSWANLSGRRLLLPFACLGLFFTFRKKATIRSTLPWLAFVCIYLLSFFIAFVRNDLPLQRTFTVLIPIFAMILAFPLSQLIHQSIHRAIIKFGVVLCIYFYCTLTSFLEYQNIQTTLQHHIQNGIRDVSVYHNYFQSKVYQPQAAAQELKKYHQQAPHPVLLFPNQLDQVTFAQYLKKENIKSYLFRRYKKNKKQRFAVIQCVDQSYPFPLGKFNQFPVKFNKKRTIHPFVHTLNFINQESTAQKYYVVTSFKQKFERWYNQFNTNEYHLQELSTTSTAFNFYLLERLQITNK